MFTLGTTGLIAAYILIALLLLSINLYSSWSWKVKATTIIITSSFTWLPIFPFHKYWAGQPLKTHLNGFALLLRMYNNQTR